MKIACLLPSNVAGGAERVMTSLANEFAEKEIESYLITFDGDTNFYSLENNVKLQRLNVNSGDLRGIKKYVLYPTYFIKLYKVIKSVKPDIVISFLFITSTVGIECCRILKIPIIISERNEPSKDSKTHTFFKKIFYKRASGFVAQSEFMKRYAMSVYKFKNVMVIPNPLSEKQVGKMKGERKKEILAVGRLVEQKNFSLLIDAYSELSEINNEYRLTIYGEGELREPLKEQIKKLGLKDKVFLPGVEIDAILKHNDARLFVMPSNYEGYPNVLVEAMANGIPVIASDIGTGVVREIIQDGYNGYIFQIGNKESLKSKIKEALEDLARLEQIGENGKKIYEELKLEKIFEMWLSFMKKTIKKD